MYTKTANKLFIDISHIVLLTEQANRFFWLPMGIQYNYGGRGEC